MVATVLTACGIETILHLLICYTLIQLQQYLPLAVLKLSSDILILHLFNRVATVLTACGIET